MLVLAIDSLFTGWGLRGTDLIETLRSLSFGLIVKSFLPAAWLGFSLTYSRGDLGESLARWKIPFAMMALLPMALSLGLEDQLLELTTTGPESEGMALH